MGVNIGKFQYPISVYTSLTLVRW